MGNALVDIITRLDDDSVLQTFGLPRGSMTLVDLDTSNFIHVETGGLKKIKTSGGSAANTIHGLAHMGVETGFIGSVGNDDMGRFFKKDMEVNRIKPILFRTMNETGRAMALISPDSERTFATYLGAAVDLTTDDITHDIFRGYDYFYVEGYLVQNPQMLEKALRLASAAGLKVCMDMASYNIVEQNREFFLSVIPRYVDILFANEEEITTLAGKTVEQSALDFKDQVEILVVKLGAQGSFCVTGDRVIRIGVRPSRPIDTTGAGDLYASGFLYGMIMGYDLETCGKIGSILAGRVIELIGAKMDESHWEILRREIRSLDSTAVGNPDA